MCVIRTKEKFSQMEIFNASGSAANTMRISTPSLPLFLADSEYRAIPRLDTYEGEYLDESQYEGMSPGARVAAERALRKRDRQEALATGRMRPGLLYEESEDEEGQTPLPRRRRPMEGEEGMEFEEVGVERSEGGRRESYCGWCDTHEYVSFFFSLFPLLSLPLTRPVGP